MLEEEIPYIKTVEQFESVISSEDCVVFWTQKTNHESHRLAALANEQPNRKLPVYKVDIDVLRKKTLEYAIRFCPFITVFRRGMIVEASTKMTTLITTQIGSRTSRDVQTQRNNKDLIVDLPDRSNNPDN